MFAVLLSLSLSLIPVPKRHPGIHMGPAAAKINVEIFVDATCPDCGQIWPNIEKALETYKDLNVDVQWLCLPSHTWSHDVTRAVFAVKSISEEKAIKVMHGLFAEYEQQQFYPTTLANVPENEVHKRLTRWIVDNYDIDESEFTMAFYASDNQMDARITYKYAFIKNVPGTPTVYINGDQSTLNEGSSWSEWASTIDALLKE